MARYRRNFIAGGTFFFTVKLADPKSRLLVEHIGLLRAAYMDVQKQYPFETVAVCVLPNHIHAIWTLPPDDADYSLRWRLIKTKFSAHFLRAESLSASKQHSSCTIYMLKMAKLFIEGRLKLGFLQFETLFQTTFRFA